MTFTPDMNVHFIFEDNNRSQPSHKFDEKEKDSDISRNANDQPYCLDDKTESDALSCESKDPGKFDSVIDSAVKEPKFLVFFLCLSSLLGFYLTCSKRTIITRATLASVKIRCSMNHIHTREPNLQ